MSRRIPKPTCFALGAASGVVAALWGLLMALGQGAGSWLRIAAFALFGGMLLFFAAAQKGENKKTERVKLLVLFFFWMFTFPNLPPLSEALGAAVPILFVAWYREGEMKAWWLGLVVAELAQALARTIAIVPSFLPGHKHILVGLVILAAGVVRGVVFVLLYRHEAAKPQETPETKMPPRPGATPPGALG